MSKLDLDTYGKGESLSKVEAHLNDIELVLKLFEGTDTISDELSWLILGVMISDTPALYQSNSTVNKKRDDEDMYCTVGTVKAKY